MRSTFRSLRALLLSAALLAPVITTGCAVSVGYRVHDPYYNDYHVFDGAEIGYYNRWAVETHRDPHRDFRKLKPAEQHEYFTWRHEHH